SGARCSRAGRPMRVSHRCSRLAPRSMPRWLRSAFRPTVRAPSRWRRGCWRRCDRPPDRPSHEPRAARARRHDAARRVRDGVALDFAAWGDSLACYMPPRRQGVALDAAVDTLGICAPGPLGVHVLAATWEPPDSAWARADFEDTLLVVRWVEARDSLALGVG